MFIHIFKSVKNVESNIDIKNLKELCPASYEKVLILFNNKGKIK
jgi:hypothetical protein